jgi:hypothetical protein
MSENTSPDYEPEAPEVPTQPGPERVLEPGEEPDNVVEPAETGEHQAEPHGPDDQA